MLQVNKDSIVFEFEFINFYNLKLGNMFSMGI